MITNSLTRRAALGLLTTATVAPLLGACATTPAAESGSDSVTGGADYPRTVTTDGGPVTIKSEVAALVALSSDIADVALALVEPSRLAAVPRTTTQPAHSHFATQAQQVPHIVEVQGVGDPEKVLSYGPDLVALTTRHERESDARAQLEHAGVPMVAITNSWDTPEVFVENVRLLGTVLGAEDVAAELIADHQRRWQAVVTAAPTTPTPEQPVVGIVRTIADNLYVTGPGSIGAAVLQAVGVRNLADEAGLSKTSRLEVEPLVKARPDVLVLVDSTGTGRQQYAQWLASPGVAQLPAVRDDKLIMITSGDLASGTGGIVALEKIAAALEGWR